MTKAGRKLRGSSRATIPSADLSLRLRKVLLQLESFLAHRKSSSIERLIIRRKVKDLADDLSPTLPKGLLLEIVDLVDVSSISWSKVENCVEKLWEIYEWSVNDNIIA